MNRALHIFINLSNANATPSRFISKAVAIFALFLISINASSEINSSDVLKPGPYGVGSMTFTLKDKNRVTQANGEEAEIPYRELTTTIWFPASPRPLEFLRPSPTPTTEAKEAFPLLIYSHGFMSYRKEAQYLYEHLASLGYVIAALDYPLTSMHSPGGVMVDDVVNQPGDISFVIDSLLSQNNNESSHLHGVIDANRIGLLGLSLGGMTTTIAAFHNELRDPRIKAAASIAGPAVMFGPDFFTEPKIPFLMLSGTIDAFIPFASNAKIIPDRVPGSILVTLENASHTGYADFADPFMSWMDNPDFMGCASIKDKVPEEGKILHLLGGEKMGVLTDAKDFPCLADTLPKAMKPKRQHELTILAITSFFESHFSKLTAQRSAMNQYLLNTLASDNADAQVTQSSL